MAGLAGEARALFTSLRQLHELMSGPRGGELSPRGEVCAISAGVSVMFLLWLQPGPSCYVSYTSQLTPLGGFSMPSTPKEKSPLPEDEDFLSVATFGPALLAQELPPCAQDHSDPELQLVSENQHLCTADVKWMASLMQTLSASLQDGGIWMQGDDVS